jgi:hypothetical protein
MQPSGECDAQCERFSKGDKKARFTHWGIGSLIAYVALTVYRQEVLSGRDQYAVGCQLQRLG